MGVCAYCGKPRDAAETFKGPPRKDWYYHSPFTNKETEAQHPSANKGQTQRSNLGSPIPEDTSAERRGSQSGVGDSHS